MENDPWWEVLLAALSSCGKVRERKPHGLVLTVDREDGTTTEVEVVMSREEWDDLVSISWGVCETAALHVRQLLLQQPHLRVGAPSAWGGGGISPSRLYTENATRPAPSGETGL